MVKKANQFYVPSIVKLKTVGKSNWLVVHDETINELINQFDKILIELLEGKMLK